MSVLSYGNRAIGIVSREKVSVGSVMEDCQRCHGQGSITEILEDFENKM